MNPYNNYIHYIEPPVLKNAVIYKKTPTKIVHNHNQNQKYLNDSGINFNKMKARATKYISDKRYREGLDISSQRNKNILIESDSELTTNSKNNANANTGVTRLVIEKIESQVPQTNQDYYKFTNLQRNKNDASNTQEAFFSKKNYVTKKGGRFDSNIRRNNRIIDGNYYNFKYNNYNINREQDYEEYPEPEFRNNLNNGHNSSMTKQLRGNKNNLFNSKYNYKHDSSNKKSTNKNNSVIIRERERNKSKKYNNNNDNMYEEENEIEDNYNEPYLPDKPNNMKYYKVGGNNIKYARKNKDININPQKNTLYENYQDLIKLNTFNRISQYNKGNNGRKYTKINSYPGFNKKLIKIQSTWRGAYVRILMGFYWNLVEFKNTLEKIFKNHIYDYFFSFVKNMSHYPKKLNGKSNLKSKKEEKTLEEYITALNQKEEDYDNLLKSYNALVEQCTELQDLVNKNKSEEKKNWSSGKKVEKDNSFNMRILDIPRNKINFSEYNKEDEKYKWKKLQIDNHNVNVSIIINKKNKEANKRDIYNKPKDIKQFDIIKIVKNDKFDIIQKNEIKDDIEQDLENKDDNNNKNLRAKYKKKKKESYQNYVENFISNLCVAKTERLIIEEIPKNKEIVPLTISQLEVALINNEENKKPKIFENKYIQKDNHNEISILGTKKEIEIIQKNNEPKEINLVEEKQKEIEIIKENKTQKQIILVEEYKKELRFDIKGKEIIEKKEKENNNIISSNVHNYEILEKERINEISDGERFNLINMRINNKPKIFENELILKDNDNELSIIGVKKKEKGKKEIILIEENQKHLNLEIKGKEVNINESKDKDNKENIIISNVPISEIKSKEQIIEINNVEQFNIMKTKLSNQSPKIFEKESIEKYNNNELTILGIKKEVKKVKKLKKKK